MAWHLHGRGLGTPWLKLFPQTAFLSVGTTMMKRIFPWCFLGVCAFVGGLVGVSLGPRIVQPVFAQSSSLSAVPSGGNEVLKLGDRFEQVARKLAPSVVAIEAIKPAAAGKAKPVEESGSGVIIRPEGTAQLLVLTNNHVVTGAPADKITVSLADGKLLKPGRVWADPESDIALLRLDGLELPTASLGDSDGLRVGQWVLAFGSPFGLNQTVTHGIISAKERGQVSLGSTIRIKEFLQTDAAINPGSSGGPLVNLDGEVIGINTAIASHSGSNAGVAFSIPINMVKRVTKQLLEKGTVSRGYLGMQMVQSFESADALRLGLDRVQGALVEAVYPETPAASCGMKVDDVVLQVDSLPIKNENHLINMISGLTPGQRVQIQVWRDRKITTLSAVVGDWTANQGRFQPMK
jgi:serine protease Do